MTQAHAPGMSAARPRGSIGWQWWAALVVVTVVLGLAGRSDGGFWGVFLWSVVGFVVGSLVAIALAGRAAAVGGGSDLEASPGVSGTAGGVR